MNTDIFWITGFFIILLIFFIFQLKLLVWLVWSWPMKKIRKIAEQNKKSQPDNWWFIVWLLSWGAVFLYWLLNEKDKNIIGTIRILGKYKKLWIFILAISLVLGWFYWFEIRPAQIRHDCSWVEKYQVEVPEVTQAQYDECINQCNSRQNNTNAVPSTGTINLNKFLSAFPCNCTNPHPTQPAKSWWERATKAQYDFCIHEKGL